jgi:hypothetical protein
MLQESSNEKRTEEVKKAIEELVDFNIVENYYKSDAKGNLPKLFRKLLFKDDIAVRNFLKELFPVMKELAEKHQLLPDQTETTPEENTEETQPEETTETNPEESQENTETNPEENTEKAPEEVKKESYNLVNEDVDEIRDCYIYLNSSREFVVRCCDKWVGNYKSKEEAITAAKKAVSECPNKNTKIWVSDGKKYNLVNQVTESTRYNFCNMLLD